MCSEIIDGACVIWGNGWSYNHGMVMPSELRAAYLYPGNGPSTGSGTSGSRSGAFVRALIGPGLAKIESGLAKIGTCLSATLHGSSCSKGGVTQIDRTLGSETAQILTGAAEIGVGTAMIISPTASDAIQCYEGAPSGCAGLALAAATAGIAYGGAAWFDDIARATNRALPPPGMAVREVGRHLESVEDVFANPQLLSGRGPGAVRSIIGGANNWVEGTMRHSNSAPNGGWTFRELTADGANFTGRYIQWHPGTPRHYGGDAYWKVSSGPTGTVRIPQ